jgi:hypothetical protein
VKVTALSCGKCGAPLSVPERTQFLTCTFCGSRLEVHREGGAAYTAVLEKLADDLETVRLQNELERVDREYETALQDITTDQNGKKLAATPKGVFLGTGLFVVFFAVVWIAATIAMDAPFFFPLMGVGFVVFALVILRYGSQAHDRARALRAEHEQRRADLVARLAKRASADGPGRS